MAKKKQLPLVLSVKAANWRMFDDSSESADAEFKHVRTKVLDRDDRTCQFCGFRAPKYQEVHHLNDNHADNRPENLVTACMFCHSVQHIGLAGRNKEAVLAFIPEIPQDQIHHIVRSILVVRRWADGFTSDRRQRPETILAAKGMVEGAEALETKLRSRESQAEEILGTSDPLELANILQQIANDIPGLYDRRAEFLQGIRLLPLGKRVNDGVDQMNAIVDTWLGTGGPFANLEPRSWVSLLKQGAI